MYARSSFCTSTLDFFPHWVPWYGQCHFQLFTMALGLRPCVLTVPVRWSDKYYPKLNSSNNTIIMNMFRVPQPLPQTRNYKIKFHLNKYSWALIGQVTLNHGKKGVGNHLVLCEAQQQLQPCGCGNDLQTIGILFHKDNIITIKHWFACSLCETKPKLNVSSLVPRSQLLARG